MKRVLILLALVAGLFVGNVCAQTAYGSQLAAGQYMHASDSMMSSNGKYVMFFQGDGNLVIYRSADMSVVWSSGTYGTGANLVAMQGDGNFVIYKGAGTPATIPVWSAGTSGHSPAVLKLTDYGQLGVFVDTATWSTNTSDGSPLSKPSIIFGNGSAIPMDGRHYNSGTSGQYNLAFQTDGNLVLYRLNTVIWNSRTEGTYASLAVMEGWQLDFFKGTGTFVKNYGNIVSDPTVWQEQSYLAFQNDGNLVIYAPTMIWSSPSPDVPPAAPHSDGVSCGGGNPYDCVPNIDPWYGFDF